MKMRYIFPVVLVNNSVAMTIYSKERALLESFIVDNEELEELESKLAQFNIFEALGVVRQELRHSNFLAFLLNPSQNHRLDDIFLKRFLKKVLLETDVPTNVNYANISAVDIDIADLTDAEVKREWQNIDIFIHSPRNKLVCAIENKVDSREHSNQLLRYREIIEVEYKDKDYRKIIIYLTPEGDQSSDPNWRICNYSKVMQILDSICTSYKSTLGADIYTLISHYSTLLRRHIVSDSEVAELCRKIYFKHKQALDLIFEHRPDLQLEMAEKITRLASEYIETHKIYVKCYSKGYIGFAPKEWQEKIPLAFHFENNSTYLAISLLICPWEDKTLRQRIYDLSQKPENLEVFKKKRWKKHYIIIYQKQILNPKDYEDANIEELMKKVQEYWDKFIQDDFAKIKNLINTNINNIISGDIIVHPEVRG